MVNHALLVTALLVLTSFDKFVCGFGHARVLISSLLQVRRTMIQMATFVPGNLRGEKPK